LSSTEIRLQIAVYAIARDEAKHVRRFLDACAGADLVMVADTGSTDGTMEALRDGGAVVHRIGILPWRFDTARNAALALLPATIDLCIALDLDEVLSPGWRAALEAECPPGTTRAHYLYAWSHHPDGQPAVEFWADKIHARAGYRWRHPCHEALYPDRIEERHAHLQGLRIDHWPDDSKSRGQYVPLLRAAVAEDPDSARDSYYLGRELLCHGDFDAAEAELIRHLALPGATCDEQNSICMGLIAKCRIGLGDRAGALPWLRRATGTTPHRREAWVDLAETLYHLQDWPGCHAAALRALAIEYRPGVAVNDPRASGALPHDLASIAAWRMGLPEDALLHAAAAQRLEPEDRRLQENVEVVRRLREEKQALLF
jgi:tetratricopeptide (TPR) repeat protein